MRRLTVRIVWLTLVVVLPLFFISKAIAERQGEKAPEFELSDVQGLHHRLSDYRGKVVLLNFWASWCPECIEEMPSLNTLYGKYGGSGLVVLGIAADRTKEPVLQVREKTRTAYPMLLDATGGVFIKRYTVIGLPTTIVIDRNGFIAGRFIGRTNFGSSSFMRKIEGLIDQGGKR